MSHRHLLILLGLVLIATGIEERGWMVLAVWLGGDFLVLGIAYARGLHHRFSRPHNNSTSYVHHRVQSILPDQETIKL